ncbi:putative phospholipase/carboxylesterase [Aspergillus affinis]|uniref:putative phospholipase/carboxylesterase n=1 Tax=Aspergillus affinis TaxID=1070780 RepID=UPI0022FED3D2|nr:putative phospholipase/carboxylesterase [Aspergillus affinis]KAI9038574.1 putative phospholipase/carboxylesterase [Aspergillus affinis]
MLIDDEARLLSESNDPTAGNEYSRVVIGGLSQGCAASIFCLLGGFSGPDDGQDKRLGGFVGMRGWLPFESEISGLLELGGENEDEDTDDDDDNDPFSHDDDDDDENEDIPASIQALNLIRDVLNLSPL